MASEPQSPCVNCGGTDFIHNEGLVGLPTVDPRGAVNLSGPVLPIIAWTCKGCSALRLLHASMEMMRQL